MYNYLSSGFLEAGQFTVSVRRNTEYMAAADAEGVIQNLDFRGGKHQTNSTKKMSSLSRVSQIQTLVLAFDITLLFVYGLLTFFLPRQKLCVTVQVNITVKSLKVS